MEFDIDRLLIVLEGSFLIGAFGLLILHGKFQRLMMLGLLTGILFYNGISIAQINQLPTMFRYYFVFFTSVIIGFYFSKSVFLSASVKIGQRLVPVMENVDKSRNWQWIIVIYLLLFIFPLVWPKFELQNLIFLPSPNLTEMFTKRFTEEPDVLCRLVGYIQLLLTPFFYVALYSLRNRLRLIFVLLALVLYMQYATNGYISRSEIMHQLGIVLLATWFLHPEYRRRMMITGAVVLPVLSYGLYVYQEIRIGGMVGDIDFINAIRLLFEGEWNFVSNVGAQIIETGARVDLAAYLTWMITLPIPKVLTGVIEGARINYEISEIITGQAPGSPGFWVVLPGLVAESVYIFGPYYFWLHGIFIGFLAGFMTRLMERTPQFLFLYMYVVLLFALILNRAGLTAILPIIVNGFLLFYIYIFFIVFRLNRPLRFAFNQSIDKLGFPHAIEGKDKRV